METLPVVREVTILDEYSFFADDVELIVPISKGCTCGDYRCNGLYVKTHIGQNGCFFTIKSRNLDIFLPSAWEFENLIVHKFVKDILIKQVKYRKANQQQTEARLRPIYKKMIKLLDKGNEEEALAQYEQIRDLFIWRDPRYIK